MVNDEKYINEVLERLKKVSDEEIVEAIQKVDLEDDIKILEEIKRPMLACGFKKQSEILKAIENLLKRYKELEEEVESQDKTIGNLIECQTEREKYTHSLEEENKKLIKANDTLKATKRIKTYKEIEKYFIPISVIQNKLEKLKREFDFYAGREHFEWQDGEFDGEVCDDIALKIGVLKELLQESDNK